MSVAAAGTRMRELAAIVGEANVWEEPGRLARAGIDDVTPAVEVTPRSEEEVAAVLRLAGEQGWVVVPAGGMTAQHTGALPTRIDVLLRTTALNQVEHYDPGDLTIGLQAGATGSSLLREVGAHRQFLPIDTNGDRTTIGGMLARNAVGPLAAGYGTLRDFCIGIRFATAEGKLVKGGGRVVKNVAGYDLMKLLIGSHGTLGVIVSANFRLFPAPRQTRTFVMPFGSLAEAIAYRDRLLRSPLTPMCVEIMSPRAAEYAPHGAGNGWSIALRASGSDAVLARYRSELNVSAGELEGEAERRFWEAMAAFGDLVAARHANAMVMKVDVPLRDMAPALEAAERAGLEQNLYCALVGRATVGSLVLAFIPLEQPTAMQYAQAASALRAALPRDGSAVVLRCPVEAKLHFDVWGSSPTDLEMMRAVKRAMDPSDILNRGRFLL